MKQTESENTKQNQNRIENHDSDSSRVVVITPEQPSTTVEGETETVAATVKKPAKKKRNRWLILGAIALLVGGSFLGWRWWHRNAQNQSPAAQSQARAIPVKIATVSSGTIEESSDFVANLDSRRSVTLAPQVQGRVSQILVRPGDEVKAGAPIIQINQQEQQAAVRSAQAATAAAREQVASAGANIRALEAERRSNLSGLQLSQRQYERYSRLANQGAISRETRDQYLNQLQAAQSSVAQIDQKIEAQKAAQAQAQRSVQQAQANIQQSQAQLQYFQITAPFAGTVGNIPVKLGDLVSSSTVLTTITENRPLEVNISIPYERAAEVKIGTTVELLNDRGEAMGTSRVFFISPRTVDETQSVLIKALFDNSKKQLRANSSVQARVIWNRRPGVLIPTTAVSRVAGQTFIYVAAPQQGQPQTAQQTQGQAQLVARQKLVKLGGIQGNNYQVLEGLQPGERIVVSGLLNLRDGVPITPAPAQNTGRGGQGGTGGA